jgi:hypothetical protein
MPDNLEDYEEAQEPKPAPVIRGVREPQWDEWDKTITPRGCICRMGGKTPSYMEQRGYEKP